jgi:hypothetical protein
MIEKSLGGFKVMAIFKLEIDMGNAAFGDPVMPEFTRAEEIRRILLDYCDRIEDSELVVMNLRDINGNKVGGIEITED